MSDILMYVTHYEGLKRRIENPKGVGVWVGKFGFASRTAVGHQELFYETIFESKMFKNQQTEPVILRSTKINASNSPRAIFANLNPISVQKSKFLVNFFKKLQFIKKV